MATVNLDGKKYDIDSLSEEAKATETSLKFFQSELQTANAKAAISKTAEYAYVNSLKNKLANN